MRIQCDDARRSEYELFKAVQDCNLRFEIILLADFINAVIRKWENFFINLTIEILLKPQRGGLQQLMMMKIKQHISW